MSCRPARREARLLTARDAGVPEPEVVADAAQTSPETRRCTSGHSGEIDMAPPAAGSERAVGRGPAASVRRGERRAAAVMAGLELRAGGAPRPTKARAPPATRGAHAEPPSPVGEAMQVKPEAQDCSEQSWPFPGARKQCDEDALQLKVVSVQSALLPQPASGPPGSWQPSE